MAIIEGSTTRGQTWAASLAVLSLGAAAIHFAVIAEHFAEWWAFGLFFAGLGWFQALWPVAYLTRPSTRLAWLAIVANLATVLLWVWTRTVGLPFGPTPGVPEAIGIPDTVSGALELLLAGGLLLSRGFVATDAIDGRAWRFALPTLAVAGLVAVATSVAIAAGGG